jgi:hypothetical protein
MEFGQKCPKSARRIAAAPAGMILTAKIGQKCPESIVEIFVRRWRT